MPATAATLMVVSAAATMPIALFFAMMMATTTATTVAFAANMVQHLLHLFVCGIAIFNHFALKQQVKPCKRVVQVHLHRVVGNVKHAAHEAVPVFILQWHNGIFIDIIVVEVPLMVNISFFKSSTRSSRRSP